MHGNVVQLVVPLGSVKVRTHPIQEKRRIEEEEEEEREEKRRKKGRGHGCHHLRRPPPSFPTTISTFQLHLCKARHWRPVARIWTSLIDALFGDRGFKAPKPKGKGKDKDKGNDKEKQSWSLWIVREEEGLLVCMLEEFKDGVKWRAENGFKSAFFRAVETLSHKMFPGTTIRANPNIKSKHVQFHPKASGMNGRAFPMYPSWQILGKDRATSELEKDLVEIRGNGSELEIDQPEHDELFVKTNDCYPPRYVDGGFVFGGATFVDLSAGGSQAAYPTTPTSNANATTTPMSHANPPPKKAKKLSRAEAKQVALNEVFECYMTESKEVMEKLVVVVRFEQRMSDKK
ncbi:hypothetical protein Vadar_030539 [Vaccinium darrowii]|uniref:Uncharacterized protein n=1 Tax=Vaccinium darrowii TaxID=229202 RepID=A0ACB7YA47_9ERIC|nr:hypothetical protein Vadar_030539 [Vaccinium darrowii]